MPPCPLLPTDVYAQGISKMKKPLSYIYKYNIVVPSIPVLFFTLLWSCLHIDQNFKYSLIGPHGNCAGRSCLEKTCHCQHNIRFSLGHSNSPNGQSTVETPRSFILQDITHGLKYTVISRNVLVYILRSRRTLDLESLSDEIQGKHASLGDH